MRSAACETMTELHTTAQLYVATQGGIVEAGIIKLEGYTLVKDEELRVLRAGSSEALINVLREAQAALVTPQGTFKTKKARAAYFKVAELLGDREPIPKLKRML